MVCWQTAVLNFKIEIGRLQQTFHVICQNFTELPSPLKISSNAIKQFAAASSTSLRVGVGRELVRTYLLTTYSQQCAAVRTVLWSKIVPPQKWLLLALWPTPVNCKLTRYGNWPSLAFWPPTIPTKIGLSNSSKSLALAQQHPNVKNNPVWGSNETSISAS